MVEFQAKEASEKYVFLSCGRQEGHFIEGRGFNEINDEHLLVIDYFLQRPDRTAKKESEKVTMKC